MLIQPGREKTDVGKQAVRVAEDVFTTAGDVAKTAWTVSEPVRDVASDAGAKAGGVVVDAVAARSPLEAEETRRGFIGRPQDLPSLFDLVDRLGPGPSAD